MLSRRTVDTKRQVLELGAGQFSEALEKAISCYKTNKKQCQQRVGLETGTEGSRVYIVCLDKGDANCKEFEYRGPLEYLRDAWNNRFKTPFPFKVKEVSSLSYSYSSR